MRLILAGAIIALATAAQAESCVPPTAPACAVIPGPFTSNAEKDACFQDQDTFNKKTQGYWSCMRANRVNLQNEDEQKAAALAEKVSADTLFLVGDAYLRRVRASQ